MPRNKDPIHGFIYQLKLLMLFLHKGVQLKYDFYLRTETKEAGSFDDLVFEYRQGNQNFFRLLQAKHTLNESQKISVIDLLAGPEKDQKYSLIKYYSSYMKCKNEDLFRGGSFKDLIICTNIDFDMKDLEKNGIEVHEVKQKDDILNINVSGVQKEPKRYKFDKEFINLLKPKLEENYDLPIVKRLANCILGSKKLCKNIFSNYVPILVSEVIDTDNNTLFENFIFDKDLSDRASEFRKMFEFEIKKQSKEELDSIEDLYKAMKNKKSINGIEIELSIHASFGRNVNNENCEWPNNNVDINDVEEFLNLLTFAVNQLNEDELGKAIKEEIGNDQLNRIRTETIYRSIFLHMIDFLQDKLHTEEKKEQKKQNKETKIHFLSFKHGDDFIKNICFEIKHLQLDSYRSHLDTVEFKFKESIFEKFEDFINSGKFLWLLDSETPWLSTLLIYQSIKNSVNYQSIKNKVKNIFIYKWSDLLDNNNGEILSDFRRFDEFLIIMSCLCMIGSNEVVEKIIENIQELYFESVGEKKKFKKIIIIASSKHEIQCKLTQQFQDFYIQELCIKSSDLNRESQICLLQKENITFQGRHQLSLQKLLNIKDHGSEKQSEILNLDASELELFLRSSEIKLFNHIDYNLPTYKPNKLVTFYNIMNEITRNGYDVFAFYGNDEEIKIKFHDQGIDLMKLSVTDSLAKILNHRFLLLELESEAKEFNLLCEIAHDYACDASGKRTPALHKLKYLGNNKWIWMQTFNIKFYLTRLLLHNSAITTIRDKGNRNEYLLPEDDLISLNERLMLLVGGPGMGKSTSLSRIILNLKKCMPTSLVIDVDLNKLQRSSDSFSVTSKNQLVELLFQVLKKTSTYTIEKKIIQYKMEYPDQLILLFDGFDEVIKEKQDSVLKLFKFIIHETKANLWVTTRDQDKEKLRNSLCVSTYSFKILREHERGLYIKKLLLSSLTFSERESPAEYLNKLSDTITNHFTRLFSDFCETPLMLRFVAEKYINVLIDNESKDISETQKEIQEINLVDAFESFVHHVYEVYFTEKIKIVEWFDNESKAVLQDAYTNSYRRLAVKLMRLICDSEAFSALDVDKDNSKISLVTLSKIGLIKTYDTEEDFLSIIENISEENIEVTSAFSSAVDNIKAEFIHPSFQYFFAAEFVCNKLKTDPDLEILWVLLIDKILLNTFGLRIFENKLARDNDLSNLSSKEHQMEIIFKLQMKQKKYLCTSQALRRAAKLDLRKTVTFLSKCFLVSCHFPIAMKEIFVLPEDYFGPTIPDESFFVDSIIMDANNEQITSGVVDLIYSISKKPHWNKLL